MGREVPPRTGLTRKNTGYPATPYHGWFWTKKAVRDMERLAEKRQQPAEIQKVKRLTRKEQLAKMKEADWMRSGKS